MSPGRFDVAVNPDLSPMSDTPMTDSPSQAESRVGPFRMGSSRADLVGLAGSADLGLRVLNAQEQKSDYFKARCDALEFAAREFFFDYAGSSSLILQKTRDTTSIPEFIEYVFCWLVEDGLAGLILSGVSSDAGSHEQINEQEAVLRELSAEVAQALAEKYPGNPGAFVNYLDFETYAALPEHPGLDMARILTGYERLVSGIEDGESRTRVETHFCGPSIIVPAGKRHEAEIPTAATRGNQATRRYFSNEEFLVIYDSKLERYVRTIESLHVFTNLTYIARSIVDDHGKRLNARRCDEVRAEAAHEVGHWRETLSRAERAKKARISRLAEIL